MQFLNFPQLLLSLLAILAFGQSACTNQSASASERKGEPAEEPAPAPKADTHAIVMNDTTGNLSPSDTLTEAEDPAPSNPTDNTVKTGSGLAKRTVDEARLGIILDLISADLEAQQLAYISSKGQDCSGIYHKIKDLVQKKMSVLGDESKFHYPSYSKDRNSRQIANWYHENGNLHIVQDAMADRNLITPGTVVFFGRTEEKYSNLTIDLLTNPGKFVHDGNNGKIMHVAVVTQVEKDDAGNVIKYDMMHGRNSRNFASRTTANYDGPGGYAKAFAKYPFGNWNQQLVALAHIETPK